MSKEMKILRISDDDLHKRFKAEAAKRGESMTEMLEKAMNYFLKKSVDKR